MRKPLLWILALGLAALGSGLLLARRGSAAAASDGDAPLFATQAQGAGRRLQLQAREPLRSIHWLPPIPGGWVLCQVGTQADRQLIGLFKDGQLAHTLQLPRVEGTTDGFYRQAEIREARVANGILYLLVKADGSHRDWPILMALGLEGELRWAHRVQADHLAISSEAVWAWGATSAQCLPILLGKAPASGLPNGRTDLPAALTWPYEIANPTTLLPTHSGFLLSHAKGLSAWRGEAGWSHTPLPPASALLFAEPRSALVQCASGIYWQPQPGQLLKVTPEAVVLGPEVLPPSQAIGMDAALLSLLGCDDQDRLWFGLATPTLPSPGPASSPEEAAQPGTGQELQPAAPLVPPLLTPELIAAYAAHLKAPMDRLYAWKPGDKALKQLTWSQAAPPLGAPPSLPPFSWEAGFRPEGLGFLLGSEQERWWLSLKSLP